MSFVDTKNVEKLPRIPLEGSLDITFRCNMNCRHCWIRIPSSSKEEKDELTFSEIKDIVNQAQNMGCREWNLSGGEPMLRGDFPEIFDYITRKASRYCLNTNGTLITPKIAKLMRREGNKLITIYGATAKVHDHITRTPGSFEAVMRGLKYLQEAKASFTLQTVPMKGNFHQLDAMEKLAKTFTPYWRLGALWIHLSALGDLDINKEIKKQRLSPKTIVWLDRRGRGAQLDKEELLRSGKLADPNKTKYVFETCLPTKSSFYIDPYGHMTFCEHIKDPRLLCDLRKSSFKECWEKSIPGMAKKIKIPKKMRQKCLVCNLKDYCMFCPAYAYLESGDYGKEIQYLCEIAKENEKFDIRWNKRHRRYYSVADITIQIDSDLPITSRTFHPKYKKFETSECEGNELITINHHYYIPDLKGLDIGKEIYHNLPWVINRREDGLVYRVIKRKRTHILSLVTSDLKHVTVFNRPQTASLHKRELSYFPIDRTLIGTFLAKREGCYFHSCGISLDGKGFLFVGPSDAGKTTISKMFKKDAEVLSEEEVILRKHVNHYKIYGVWHPSRNDIVVSNGSATLHSVFFLNKSDKNDIELLSDKREISKRLLGCIMGNVVQDEGWDNIFRVIENMAIDIPCYMLNFDKTGDVVNCVKKHGKRGNKNKKCPITN